LAYVSGEAGKQSEETEAVFELPPGAAADCFICRAAAQSDDRRNLVILRSEPVVTLLNRFPYNNGHLLVAPRRHQGELHELTRDEHAALNDEITRLVGLLREMMHPDGFNIGLNLGQAAGAGLPGHLHWHVVPRWLGDTNFMPALAGVRVIPQSLDALWQLLHDATS